MKKSTESRIKKSQPEIDIPSDFTQKVMNGLGQRQTKRQLFFNTWMKPATVVASLALILVVGVLYAGSDGQNTLATNDGNGNTSSEVDDLTKENEVKDNKEKVRDKNQSSSNTTSTNQNTQSIPETKEEAAEQVAVNVEEIEQEIAAFGTEIDFDEDQLSDDSLSLN